MVLTLDVGNTQIFGGVFERQELTIRFRKASRPPTSSDELGLFLRSVLRENGIDPSLVRQMASAARHARELYTLRSCCRKYFQVDPFILRPGAKTGPQDSSIAIRSKWVPIASGTRSAPFTFTQAGTSSSLTSVRRRRSTS